MNRSPFESEAVLDVVHEVYGAAWGARDAGALLGRITWVAVDAEEPAGKPVAACRKRTIRRTVHRGGADDRCLQERGADAFRQSRIPDLCQEALSQGALLTRENLPYRIFFVSLRTISRDLQALRLADPQTPIPLRSTVHDIGPVLTHRMQIVRLGLEKAIRERIAAGATRRHVPKHIRQVAAVPYTISGKKVELAVRNVIHGQEVKNKDALANPEALEQYRGIV